MVRKLTATERGAIDQAIEKADRQTSAELAAVVAPASDSYRDIGLACGLLIGTAVAFWYERAMPGLAMAFCIQLALAIGWEACPLFLPVSLLFAPRRLLRHRAAKCAAAEYVHAIHHLPPGKPFVLLYVSVAERYVHVYSSREVRERIPDSLWQEVVRTLTSSIKSDGLSAAAVKAVEHAGEMLKDKFPAK